MAFTTNNEQELEYYRFLREDNETRIRINKAELALLDELHFWNRLALIINDYDVNESFSLLNWVGEVLKVNYPKNAN